MIAYILISYVFMLIRCIVGYNKEGDGKGWVKLFIASPITAPLVLIVDFFSW
jgi:hypothetical protein